MPRAILDCLSAARERLGSAAGWRLRPGLVAVGLACALVGFVLPRALPVFDFVEGWLTDLRIAALGPEMPARDDIAIVAITEDTLAQFPYRAPFDRSRLAVVLDYLAEADVRAVGLDMLLDQPTEPGKDLRLAEAIARFPAPLILGWAGREDGLTERQMAFLSAFAPEAARAHVNLVTDPRDGTVRWIFPGRESDAGFRRGFAAHLAALSGAAPPDGQIPLLYRRGADGDTTPFPTYPLHLVTLLPTDWFADRIVLIGADLPTQDRHRTPFAALLGDREGSLPGTAIHAHALSHLLDGVSVPTAGLTPELLVLAAAAAAGIWLALTEMGLALRLAAAAAALFGAWLIGFGLYAAGGPLLPLFAPSISFILAVGAGSALASHRNRMEKERAEAAAAARSEFLAVMSHEIRTPMNGVLGVIELLRASDLSDEQQQMAGIVQDSAGSLLGLLNDILDFSKIEAGKLDIAPEPVSPRRVAQAAVATFAMAAEAKGIALTAEIADDVPDWVAADGLRLRQILCNLIGNAVKFTGTGGVAVRCRREAEEAGEEGAERLVFAVADTGIGMSPKALEKLFRPFTQADSTTTRKFGGTGLGLSIAHRLAVLMGGGISASSEEGRGSVFTLRLPLEPAEAPAEEEEEAALPAAALRPAAGVAAAPDGAAGVPEVAADAPHVLVAEDNPTNQWLIRRQLAKLGYRCSVAGDGKAALEAWRAGAFDLLITDYYMPEMDGPDLARAIRRDEEGGTARRPILALTANAQSSAIETCRSAGVDAVLAKPTQLKPLARALAEHLGPAPRAPEAPDPHSSLPAPANDAAPAEAGPPVLDTAPLVEVFGEINDDVRGALAAFLDGAESLAETIDRHAAAEQGDDLARAAHRLAGESLSAGAISLGRLCKDLERAARDADWAGVEARRPQVAGRLASVRQAVAGL
jgi:signal transduction histidine kinase/HPt (histidine-containing phosphotransfer) domain-containing protein/ActR/RegA family two-component response regulator